MFNYEKEHLKAVSKRYCKAREQSPLTADEFNEAAARTLKGYGWNDAEISQILKNTIKKEG